nr:AraC family transcriptional regulator [Pantoea allii]
MPSCFAGNIKDGVAYRRRGDVEGIPAVFPCEKDRAQFKQSPELPGVELYQAHISRYAFEPHTHEAFGIGTIDAGAQRFRYRGTQYTAPAHSLVMMNPDELHTGESACEEGWRYQMIYIQPQLMDELSGDRGWWFNDALRTDIRMAQPLSQVLSTLWHAETALARYSLLSELLLQLRPLARMSSPRKAEARHRFDKVRDYLRANLAEPVRLETLAALVSLSPWHFLRAFRDRFHVTPQQMLMAYRLYEAKERLAQGEAIASVAAAVGLTDQAHLTRAFANRYGITPGRYQKQIISR